MEPDKLSSYGNKRGICFSGRHPLSAKDFSAFDSSKIAWWYNWSPQPQVPDTKMDFIPMLWCFRGDAAPKIEAYCNEHPHVRYLLALNEPSQKKQANISAQDAARQWPILEALAERCSLYLVGPQLCYSETGESPADWFNAFLVAYRAIHGGRTPRIDALGCHCYSPHNLPVVLDILKPFGKPVWLTEFAHGKARTVEEQKCSMTRFVAECEARPEVVRYAWFLGRSENPLFSLLSADEGVLTELGLHYMSLPTSLSTTASGLTVAMTGVVASSADAMPTSLLAACDVAVAPTSTQCSLCPT